MPTIVDPPEGWKYGFPKAMPAEIANSSDKGVRLQWWLDNGYPQKLIDEEMLKYVRSWEEEK